jgi:hypothetical protein
MTNKEITTKTNEELLQEKIDNASEKINDVIAEVHKKIV